MVTSKQVVAMLAMSMLALLEGCDGGGGALPSTTVSSAQGAYQGTLSNGGEHDTIMLENDQFYTIYGSTMNGTFSVSGFMQGNGKSTGGGYSATDVKDATASGLLLSGSLSATYSAGSVFNGTLTEGGNSVSVTASAIPASMYNYNTPANLNDVVGMWDLTTLRGFASTFKVSATGDFSATSGGCAFSGSFKPRASGKNVFDFAVTFGGAPCNLPGQSLNGIAFDYQLTSGKRQLLIAALDQTRSSSGAFSGTR